MCLDLTRTERPTESNGIARTADGQFLIGYKSLEVIMEKGKWILTSPFNDFDWGTVTREGRTLSLNDDIKELKESRRKLGVLYKEEARTSSVHTGFHFYTNVEDAKDGSTSTAVVVKCFIPIKRFVAQGHFGPSKSFVATETKIVSIEKQPTHFSLY